jgi:hypothetical protein
MFFGGWLYPDALSAGAGVAATLNEVTFNRDEFDCAATGTDVAQTASAPTKKKCKAFRTAMSSSASIDGLY